jgi:DNA primase
VQATKKVIELLLKLDLNGKVISFAPFKDAADFLQKNPDGWSEIVKTAAESLDWLVADAINQVSDVQFIENKKKVLKLLAPTLALITDSARRDYYVQKLAAALGMKPAAVTEALAKPSPGERPPNRLAEPAKPASTKAALPRLTNEEQLLAIVVAAPESLKGNERLLKSVVWQSSEAQTIAEAAQTCYNDKALPKTSAQFLSAVKTHLDSPLADKLDRWQFWISETWPQFSPELASELLTEKFGQVSTLEREQRKDTLAAEIKRAQEQGDIKKIKELLGTLSKLAQEPTVTPKKS